jgi:hypothetical protein
VAPAIPMLGLLHVDQPPELYARRHIDRCTLRLRPASVSASRSHP